MNFRMMNYINYTMDYMLTTLEIIRNTNMYANISLGKMNV